MSRGTPITALRIPHDLLTLVESAIQSANYCRKEAPYTKTSWIVAAIREKLAKGLRGRRSSRRRAAGR